MFPPQNPMDATRARLEIFLPSRESGQELTGAALRDGIRLEPVIEAASDTAAYVDEAIALVRAEYGPPLACREACWYCCCCPVILVAIPELLRILDAVERTFDAEQLASLRQRAAAYAERNQCRTLEELAAEQPIACPLLVDERCSVYDARPLTCRGYNSTDVDACRRNYEDGSVGTPLFAPVKDAADGALVGAVDALQAAGVNGALLDLGCALNIALNYTGDDRTRDFLDPDGRLFAAVEDRRYAPELAERVTRTARRLGLRV